MSIGDNIKFIRKERNLTQDELAKKMCISRSYLSDIENNRKNPSSKTIESLADKLGVSMSYLLEGKKTLRDLDENEKTELMNGFKGKLDEFNAEKISETHNLINDVNFDTWKYSEIEFLNNTLRFIKSFPGEPINYITSILHQLLRAHYDISNSTESVEEKKKRIDFYVNDARNGAEEFLKIIENLLHDKLK